MDWLVTAHEGNKEGSAEPLPNRLTNEQVVKLSPPFNDTEAPNRLCGSCKLRVLIDKGDIADCTKVEGGISLSKGTCRWWTLGEASPTEDIATMRMDWEEASYGEVNNPEVVITCGACYYAERVDDKTSNCLLWMSTVGTQQCCSQYKNKSVIAPPKVHIEPEHD